MGTDVITFVSHTSRPGGGELALRRYLEATSLPVRLVTLEDGGVWEGLGAEVVAVRGVRGLRSALCGGGLVVANSMRAAFLTALVVPRRGRLVYWVRDGLTDSAMSPLALALTKHVTARRARHYLANSEWTAGTVGEALHVGPERIDVVYSMCGVTEQMLQRAPRTAPHDPLRLLFLGRISRWKAPDVAVRALPLLREQGIEATLTIAGGVLFGEDDYATELRRLVDTEPAATMVGHVDDVEGLLASHDILVHCSIVPEPFGQVIVQGLAAGVPVIATADGGPTEILAEAPTELLYYPSDAASLVQRLTLVRRHYRETAAFARERAARFLDDALVRRTDTILRSQRRRPRATAPSAMGPHPDCRTLPSMGFSHLPKLSVVIVTYRRAAFLERCLRALDGEQDQIHQLVVVDASPEPDEVRAAAAFPGLTYVHAPELAGHMTRSRNRALHHVDGEVVAFLDDDVVVHPGWARAVREAFAEERIDALAGRTLNGLPGEETTAEAIGTLRPDGRLTAGFAASEQERVVVTHGIGANMAFTRDVLCRLGGFNDDYPGTALREDTDIFLRVARLGGVTMFDPAAAVDHLPAPHVHGRRFDTRYKLYGRRNHVVLLARHTGLISPTVARWIGGQLIDVLGPEGLRRKAERLGVTLIGVTWGLGAALRQAPLFGPQSPERSGDAATAIRENLARKASHPA